MTSNPKQRAFALFHDWMDLPADVQQTRLATLRNDDPALCAELERLLAADIQQQDQPDIPDDHLAQWASALVTTDDAHTAPEQGMQLGDWRLLAPLGQGGMGSVWLGERTGDGFTQRAAIKLISVGAGNPHAHARFLRERGILAQLQHPHIAGLLDGGLSQDNQPYFAMEYVQGETIEQWCNHQQLSITARIQLFLQVLDAVQYAHRNLVIHRDLKPSNVMVDQNGHVKLLDFGIAKLLEEGIGHDATRELAMTPQCAAPEQLLGQAITTATDIYQLGLMLHALLVGKHPFGVTPETPIAGLLRTLDTPPRRLEEEARHATADILQQRQSERAALVRSLSGDLSAIVATCLMHAPEQRYASADALAADLRRWLAGQPVAVRSASRRYRLRFFLRRYRWAVAATLAIILSLSAGLGVAIQQMKQARLQAQRAEQVKNLILSVFREQDPLARGSNAARTPAQIIASGIDNLTPEQLRDTRLRGELLDDLGEIQGTLGDLAGGRRTLLEALRIRTQDFGETSQEVLTTQRKLAQIVFTMGNQDEARRHAEQAIQLAERLKQPHSAEAARARLILAIGMYGGEQREQALPMLEQAITDLRSSLGGAAPETTEAMLRHAQMLQQLRREEEAIAELRDVVAHIESSNSQQSARLVVPLTALGSALRQAHQDEDADAVYARTIALAQRHFPGRNKILASPLWRYAALKMQRGQHAQAQALFDQAEQAIPEDAQTDLLQLLLNRGQLHLLQHQADLAERDLQRAYTLQKQVSGENNGITWYYASQWARGLAAQGNLVQAEQVHREALARLQTIMGKDAYQSTLLLDALAETLLLAKKPQAAATVIRQALALTASQYPPEHPVYQERLQHLQEAEQSTRQQ